MTTPRPSFPSYFLSSPDFPSSSSCLCVFVLEQEDAATGKQTMMLPLIMPVSVPVHRVQPDAQGGWAPGRPRPGEQPVGQPERKPSVIVARRRTLRNSMTQSFGQVRTERTL